MYGTYSSVQFNNNFRKQTNKQTNRWPDDLDSSPCSPIWLYYSLLLRRNMIILNYMSHCTFFGSDSSSASTVTYFKVEALHVAPMSSCGFFNSFRSRWIECSYAGVPIYFIHLTDLDWPRSWDYMDISISFKQASIPLASSKNFNEFFYTLFGTIT